MKFSKGKESKEGAQNQWQEPLCRNVMLMYSYTVLWIAMSSSVILFNKYILAYAGFPYPIGLTSLHMIFSSVVSWALVKCEVVPVATISKELYIGAVVPIGALFSVVLWFGNAAYLYLSVSFIQMLKASIPLLVFIVGVLLSTETYSHLAAFNMAIVAIGILTASFGEVQFVPIGVMLQVGALIAESFRITLVQILLQKKGIKLNPIATLYYIAPCCFAFLFPVFLWVEGGEMMRNGSKLIGLTPLLLCNAALAFGLNLSVFLLIGKTSALTMNVAGVVKDWLLIALSVAIYGSQVTKVNLLGYGIAFCGVCWYNYRQLQAVQSDGKTQDVQEKENLEGPNNQKSPYPPHPQRIPLLDIKVRGPSEKHTGA